MQVNGNHPYRGTKTEFADIVATSLAPKHSTLQR
jgi:hypothetical protein